MLKKLLMSSLILGALSATVGVGAMSAWNEDTVATGTFAAADINLQSWDGDSYEDTSTFVFNPGVLVPNQSASGQTWLKNTGNAALNIAAPTVAVTSSPNGGCASYVNTSTSGTPAALAAGEESGAITINATLQNAIPNVCEGNSFTVTVTWIGSTQF